MLSSASSQQPCPVCGFTAWSFGTDEDELGPPVCLRCGTQSQEAPQDIVEEEEEYPTAGRAAGSLKRVSRVDVAGRNLRRGAQEAALKRPLLQHAFNTSDFLTCLQCLLRRQVEGLAGYCTGGAAAEMRGKSRSLCFLKAVSGRSHHLTLAAGLRGLGLHADDG